MSGDILPSESDDDSVSSSLSSPSLLDDFRNCLFRAGEFHFEPFRKSYESLIAASFASNLALSFSTSNWCHMGFLIFPVYCLSWGASGTTTGLTCSEVELCLGRSGGLTQANPDGPFANFTTFGFGSGFGTTFSGAFLYRTQCPSLVTRFRGALAFLISALSSLLRSFAVLGVTTMCFAGAVLGSTRIIFGLSGVEGHSMRASPVVLLR